MPKTLLRIFSQGLSHDMAQLGSLTIDPIQPWSDVLHPNSPLPPAYVASTLDQRVRDTFKRAENHHFKLFLTRALQLSAISEDAFDARVNSMTRIVRYLINHEQAFEVLMSGTEKDTRVREWIQKRVDRRQDILMIVRTDTFVDSSVMAINGSSVSVQAEMSVSASQVVQGIQVPDDATQVGVDIGGRKSCEETNGYEAAGERIFAVEYRKISWRWLPHADAVQGALGILIKSLRPGPWTRGGENDIAAVAEQSLVMKIEDKVPEFTETELEEEQLEIYCDKDGDDEIEYLFAVDEDDEDGDWNT